MKKDFAGTLLLLCLLSITMRAFEPQQLPKTDRAGNPLCVVRSDANEPVTIEYRSSNQWQQVTLDPGAEKSIGGDHIRVATVREDKAVVTVDLPVQAGKKYRLIWNTQSTMWDFSLTP